ncbi:MAG: hypothetical protein ACM3O8_01810 [Methylococcaceae bacterium]|nr:hypothetical protein [Prolixibacteraceae bacterium]
MNKLLVIIISLICISTLSYSQPKTEFGFTTEGSWFTPRPISPFSESNRNGWGTGIGIYASRNIFWRFSADIGLGYRYKKMQQHYTIYTGTDNSYDYGNSYGSSYESVNIEGWKKYDLHYVVVPIHLQLLTGKYLFIRGGIEASWLTNFDSGNKKTEYNWTTGFGSQKYKIKWSVNYTRGFKAVGFLNGLYEIENGKYKSGTFYRNQMFQLNLSYPIWQKR